MKAKYKRLILVTLFAVFTIVLLLIVGCAPKQNTASKPKDDINIQLPDWTVDTDCTKCHALEVASIEDDSTPASAHPTLACISCHSDSNGKLTEAHKNYSGAPDPTRLLFTRIPDSNCLGRGCHDVEKLAEDTTGSTVFVDLVGSAINPHALPDCDAHNSNIECSSCHKVHMPMADTTRNATSVCGGCHHDGYYEPCSNCHKEED